jgi:hypothetical protein
MVVVQVRGGGARRAAPRARPHAASWGLQSCVGPSALRRRPVVGAPTLGPHVPRGAPRLGTVPRLLVAAPRERRRQSMRRGKGFLRAGPRGRTPPAGRGRRRRHGGMRAPRRAAPPAARRAAARRGRQRGKTVGVLGPPRAARARGGTPRPFVSRGRTRGARNTHSWGGGRATFEKGTGAGVGTRKGCGHPARRRRQLALGRRAGGHGALGGGGGGDHRLS